MLEIVLIMVGIYFLLGVVFAIPFLLNGVKAIDPAAVEGSRGFKLFIIPGVALFWPLLLKRWMKKAQPPVENSAHR